jgi:flavin-binding protein dodecin
MSDNVYRVTEVIGTSAKSWEGAAQRSRRQHVRSETFGSLRRHGST